MTAPCRVTYNGWSLYYFFRDAKPGDANGQDSRNVWFVVGPDGGPIQTDARVTLSDHPGLGSILTDRSGRTVYPFTNDESNVSNCSGGCAGAWPPLLTVGAPQTGDGVNAASLATIERDDGSMQVTYNGWPLYYFFRDAKPGDANGQDSRNVWFVVGPDGGPIQTDALVTLSDHPDLGSILTDRSGRTVYLFTNDESNMSNCSGGCARAWPPLLTVGAPQTGDGVNGASLATIERGDGSMQVTYNGWPLYYFFRDAKPGDANGQDSRNVWFVVGPDGGPIQTDARVTLSDHPGLGSILTDRSGRTVYLFTNDESNMSNCSGGCARAWPPLLTVGAPQTGDGVNAASLATIERDDGSIQVTYNGWPLYYFAKDQQPGNTNGQGVGDVWFVVSALGEAVR